MIQIAAQSGFGIGDGFDTHKVAAEQCCIHGSDRAVQIHIAVIAHKDLLCGSGSMQREQHSGQERCRSNRHQLLKTRVLHRVSSFVCPIV